jgi:hypothetical protein
LFGRCDGHMSSSCGSLFSPPKYGKCVRLPCPPDQRFGIRTPTTGTLGPCDRDCACPDHH